MLFDISTEEPSVLEMIGTIALMPNNGANGRLAEVGGEQTSCTALSLARSTAATLRRCLYGAVPARVSSAGVPWTAADVATVGELTADLRSNIAAQARVKIVFEPFMNLDDAEAVAVQRTVMRTQSLRDSGPLTGAGRGMGKAARQTDGTRALDIDPTPESPRSVGKVPQ